MDKETGHFRGAGGFIFEMDLPLSEPLAYQESRRELVRVNADGSPYSEYAEPTRPDVRAAKAEWVGWATHEGLDVNEADALTKNELIERFGAK